MNSIAIAGDLLVTGGASKIVEIWLLRQTKGPPSAGPDGSKVAYKIEKPCTNFSCAEVIHAVAIDSGALRATSYEAARYEQEYECKSRATCSVRNVQLVTCRWQDARGRHFAEHRGLLAPPPRARRDAAEIAAEMQRRLPPRSSRGVMAPPPLAARSV